MRVVSLLQEVPRVLPFSTPPPAASEAHALELLGRLTADAAHDLRHALGAVDLWAGLLAGCLGTEGEAATFCGHLRAALARLGVLADNLLSLADRRPALARRVDLAQVAAGTFNLFAVALRAAGIHLCQRLGPAPVVGDPAALGRLVLNLALNAMAAMPEGGTLRVATGCRQATARLTVRDTGVGMDALTRRRACEPGFTTRPRGTGLGLTIVSEVVRVHRGRLAFRTRPGAGTTVQVFLPAAP